MWEQASLCDASTWTYQMVRAASSAQADPPEEFASELESFASHLVLENQQLQHENKQLNTLLKEYEQTLESVMGKFRGVAVRLLVEGVSRKPECRTDKPACQPAT